MEDVFEFALRESLLATCPVGVTTAGQRWITCATWCRLVPPAERAWAVTGLKWSADRCPSLPGAVVPTLQARRLRHGLRKQCRRSLTPGLNLSIWFRPPATADDNTGVRAYVGVTDGTVVPVPCRPAGADRSQFLAAGGGHAFRALRPGEPFFFKSHYPQNQIVGGGFYWVRADAALGCLGTARPGERRGQPRGDCATQIARYRKRSGPERIRRSAACSSAIPASSGHDPAAPPPISPPNRAGQGL